MNQDSKSNFQQIRIFPEKVFDYHPSVVVLLISADSHQLGDQSKIDTLFS
jgi:hypothetical protein